MMKCSYRIRLTMRLTVVLVKIFLVLRFPPVTKCQCLQYTVFIGTTTTGSSLVHFKLYWVPACAALNVYLLIARSFEWLS